MLALKPTCKVSNLSLQIWKSLPAGDPFTRSTQEPELLTRERCPRLAPAPQACGLKEKNLLGPSFGGEKTRLFLLAEAGQSATPVSRRERRGASFR